MALFDPMLEAQNSAKWHRKWVLLLAVLGWVVLYRYRVMGWLLSKGITYYLSKSSKLGPITVRVERVSLQPFRVFNVELESIGTTSWRIKLSKVQVQSHVKEFFESFGLVKICVLTIEDIVGDVEDVAEQVLKEVLMPKKMRNTSGSGHVQSKVKAICYMRFVDLKVQSIRLCIRCLNTKTQFVCQDLYTGITDVFALRNMLQLKVQVKSIALQSSFQVLDESISKHESDGLRLEVPSTSVVFKLDLLSQRFLGCKLTGSEEMRTNFVLATAFLERILGERNNILGKRMDVAKDVVASGNQEPSALLPVAMAPLDIELVDFYVSITVANDVESIGNVPIQFCADVRSLSYRKHHELVNESLDEEQVASIVGKEGGGHHDGMKVHVEAVVENTCVRNLDSSETLLSVCCIELQAKQNVIDRGVLVANVGKVELFLSHRTAMLFTSLAAVQQRVNKYQMDMRNLFKSTRVQRLTTERCSLRESRGHGNWDAKLEISSWMLTFRAFSKANGIDHVTAYGTATSVQTPVLNGDSVSVLRRCIVIQQITVDVLPHGLRAHSSVFGGVELAVSTSLNCSQSCKINAISAKIESVSINSFLANDSDDMSRLPTISLHHVKVNREQKVTNEFDEVDLTIDIDKTNVRWDYRHHEAFLSEWMAIKNIMDQLELLLLSSSKQKQLSRPPTDPSDQTHAVKTVSTNICSGDTAVNVLDIPGVTTSATFVLIDSKVSHRVTQLSATTSCHCASANLRWGDKSPCRLELTDGSFHTRSSLGRQKYLTKVPIQSDLRCGLLKLRLCPQSQLMLLFLRLDHLFKKSSEKLDSDKRSAIQGLSLACGQLVIELKGQQVATIEVTTFDVKMTRCAPREITKAVARLVQDLGKEGLADWSFTEVAHHVIVMEGSVSASVVSAAIPSKKVIELHDTELRFSMTDVAWSPLLPWDQLGRGIPRTTCIDLSMLTDKLHLVVERKSLETLLRSTRILQEAFNTKQVPSSDDSEPLSPDFNFRLRYAGNFDVAFQHAELTCPYGDKAGRGQIENKVARIVLDDLATNVRQFQVLGIKCSSLQVVLADATLNSDRVGDSLQLLFVPEISVNSFIHWKQGLLYTGQLQYSLTLEMALGSPQSFAQPVRVPNSEETLVAMNWDCVYPWLIYMIADDIYECPDRATCSTDTTDQVKPFQCIGLQWDLSVNVIQFVWWDTATQELGMLVVVSEFLTHGVFRADSCSHVEQGRQVEWKLWEAIVYLHLLRGYLLHVTASANEAIPGVIPFGSELTSNFSLETLGTSYRKTYSPEEDEDWDELDDQVVAMFTPPHSTNFEKMHENFAPIDYNFGIPRPTKQDMGRPPILQSSSSTRSSSNATSPSKSPRSAKTWAQNMKSRLLRLKHRSASMDNLFLKDGSCPIQVDAMRLLWTIQTRDSVFYMVATTVDSLRLLFDAKKNVDKADGHQDGVEVGSVSPLRREKRSSFRSPSIVAESSDDVEDNDPIVETPRVWNHRGSIRETLLDLLQQGKLGDSDRETSSSSLDVEHGAMHGNIGEDTSDYDAPKVTIATKAYTVDIHDAQINVREETTRSNMLLASKHIHFEIGTDASESDTIANLTFDNVTAHVAPIDVDISAGVLWYSHSNTSSSSALLKQMMEECSLTSSYTVRATGVTSTEVDLSFLQLSTDRHQFYQLMNVIRHVLLAPPSVARRPNRTSTPRTGSTESPQQLEGSDITVVVPSSSSTNAPGASTSAKKLHVLLEEELRNREIRTRGTAFRSKLAMTALKVITFKVVGMQWRLRLSPEIAGADYEFVGINIQGFTGCHTYFTNHCTKLTLNLQWLEVSNLKPGPSSAAFEDPTAVLKAKLLVDKRFESSSKGALGGNQKGMLVVRAEGGPVVRVHGQKLRVLEVLEVSMFPEIANMIVIQLAADFYDLIYKFFFEKISSTPASSHNSEQVFFGRKSMHGSMSPPTSTSTFAMSPKSATSPFTKARVSSTSLGSQSSQLGLRKINSAGLMHDVLAEGNGTLSSAHSLTSISCSDEAFDENEATAPDDCELFYVQYVRVGNVRLRINCNGFFVNLSHFDLILPPYVCQSKLCTTKQLLQKFESHLKWYITKESASSGLSQFKNKLLKWTPSTASSEGKRDRNKKQEEDTAAANAQVLFGPYSGTST